MNDLTTSHLPNSAIKITCIDTNSGILAHTRCSPTQVPKFCPSERGGNHNQMAPTHYGKVLKNFRGNTPKLNFIWITETNSSIEQKFLNSSNPVPSDGFVSVQCASLSWKYQRKLNCDRYENSICVSSSESKRSTDLSKIKGIKWEMLSHSYVQHWLRYMYETSLDIISGGILAFFFIYWWVMHAPCRFWTHNSPSTYFSRSAKFQLPIPATFFFPGKMNKSALWEFFYLTFFYHPDPHL